MAFAVSDKASSPDDNVAGAVKAIGRSKVRRRIFDFIYTGRSQVKMADQIARALKVSKQQVLNEAKPLAAHFVIEVVRVANQTGYRKDPFYQHHKARILRALEQGTKVPTKSEPRVAVVVSGVRLPKAVRPTIKEITVDDIDSFSKVRNVTDHGPIKISEKRFKEGVKRILSEGGSHKDWGGEANDLATTRLKFKGKRRGAAFAFKGPGTTGKLVPGKMGKNGDQAQRLFGIEGEIFVAQYHGQIADTVRDLMAALARSKSMLMGKPIYYCVMDGGDSARLIRAYPKAFGVK